MRKEPKGSPASTEPFHLNPACSPSCKCFVLVRTPEKYLYRILLHFYLWCHNILLPRISPVLSLFSIWCPCPLDSTIVGLVQTDVEIALGSRCTSTVGTASAGAEHGDRLDGDGCIVVVSARDCEAAVAVIRESHV